MRSIYWITSLMLFAIATLSCQEKSGETSKTESNSQVTAPKAYAGTYVSGGYAKRMEGYDWVGVKVQKLSEEKLAISVRSRADKKKPTCTFDAEATKLKPDTFAVSVQGKQALLAFHGNSLTIFTEKAEDEGVLNFYCSGGGSLADNYMKIEGSLDEKQVDPTLFHKTLSLQNIGFNFSTKKKGDQKELTVEPYGLSIDNRPFTHELEGKVTGAEIEDLNSDGYPEVLIYTQSGDNQKGNVIAYSVNNGKSISRVYFPPIADNPQLNKGYNGHDEFSTVETSLVQRFPIYEKDQPTGKIRQIQYELAEGEASRKFVVKKEYEFEK